jgi:hypothetical protein
MFWIDLLLVLAIVLLLAPVFGARDGRYTAGLDLAMFFVLLFLATWALGGWFRPLGPPLWGTYWVSYLIAAVLIALLLTAALATPSHREAPRTEARQGGEPPPAPTTAIAVGIAFWLFAVVALGAIIASYIW